MSREWSCEQRLITTGPSGVKGEEPEDDLKEVIEVLVDFLKLFDVSGRCGEEEQKTAIAAADALGLVLLTRNISLTR